MKNISGKTYQKIDRDYSLIEALKEMHMVDGLEETLEVVREYLESVTPTAWDLKPIMDKEEMLDYSRIDVSMNNIHGE